MKNVIKLDTFENKVYRIRKMDIILDRDVAFLYGVETKRINEALKNNPEKFPEGYVFDLTEKELSDLRSKFSTANLLMSRVLPKAFTEKGLYMLATILKSPKATQTTIAIVETFAKIRELSRNIVELSASPDENKQRSLMQKSGEIISDILGEDLSTSNTETSIELNFAVLKIKHTIKRK